MTKAIKYEAVATVVSKRDPDRVWHVKRHVETKALSCDCPAWIFKPVCGLCEVALTKRSAGGLWCAAHGAVGEGKATRSCKHIRAYRNQEANAALVGVAQGIGGGAAVELLEPEVAATLSALLWAADRAHLRSLLYERQWKELAGHLSIKVRGGLVATVEAPQQEFDFRGVRQIVLED